MNKPFQRVGSISNAQTGSEFEKAAQAFFAQQGLELQSLVVIVSEGDQFIPVVECFI